jgi:hypothetical protein
MLRRDTGGHQQGRTDLHRLVAGRDHRLGHPFRLRGLNVEHGHDELVPAHARYQVGRPGQGGQALSEHGQQTVTGGMAQAVDDQPKSVKVNRKNGQLRGRPIGEKGLDFSLQSGQVQQPSEGVMGSLVGKLHLCLLDRRSGDSLGGQQLLPLTLIERVRRRRLLRGARQREWQRNLGHADSSPPIGFDFTEKSLIGMTATIPALQSDVARRSRSLVEVPSRPVHSCCLNSASYRCGLRGGESSIATTPMTPRRSIAWRQELVSGGRGVRGIDRGALKLSRSAADSVYVREGGCKPPQGRRMRESHP